jgi:hypothetical protein
MRWIAGGNRLLKYNTKNNKKQQQKKISKWAKHCLSNGISTSFTFTFGAASFYKRELIRTILW